MKKKSLNGTIMQRLDDQYEQTMDQLDVRLTTEQLYRLGDELFERIFFNGSFPCIAQFVENMRKVFEIFPKSTCAVSISMFNPMDALELLGVELTIYGLDVSVS